MSEKIDYTDHTRDDLLDVISSKEKKINALIELQVISEKIIRELQLKQKSNIKLKR